MNNESWLDAAGVFETLRTYQNKPFGLAEHLERLQRGINDLEITAPSIDEIEEQTYSYLENYRQDSGHLRLVVDSIGRLTFSHQALPSFKENLRVNLINSEISNRLSYKSTNYRERLELRADTQRVGFDDSIICDSDELVEATTCNIIFLLGGKWWTPPLGSGCLPGVTRQLLIDNFGVEELSLNKEDVRKIDAIALTSSLREIQRIQEVDGKVFPHSHLLERLQVEFHAWILGNLSL